MTIANRVLVSLLCVAATSCMYAGLMSMQSIETVAASEAPAPEGGPGWYCYETRRTRYSSSSPNGDTQHYSSCLRTLNDCRASSDETAHMQDTSDRERIEVDVSPCQEQATAFCSYRWFEGAEGEHGCSARMQDCQSSMLTYTAPGGATRQAECSEAP